MTDATTEIKLSGVLRAALVAAAFLCALCLASTPKASASKTQPTIFDATSSLLSAPTADSRNATLDQIDRVGTDTVRIVVPWRFLAPSPGSATPPAGFNAADPHSYPQDAWAALDASVLGITQRGMKPLLTVSSPFPDWASVSGKSGLSDPKPSAYKDFMTAIGRRYGGSYRVDPGRPCPPGSVLPGTPIDPILLPYTEFCQPIEPSPLLPDVTNWGLWNEPDQALFLKPQFRKGKPYSPKLYRRLFVAGSAGLGVAGKAKDTILIGETAPSGGTDGVDPIDFMRGVFCLDAKYRPIGKCAPIDATAWAHHPYSPGVAPFRTSDNPGLVNVQTIGKLINGLKRAGAAHATTHKLKIWVTEFGVQSKPDKRFGVSYKNQAGYLAIAEYKLWKLGAVRTFAQYLLRDDSLSQKAAFTTGLQLHSGKPKVSFDSFPMTLLVKRQGQKRVLIWGHVRPGSGRHQVTVNYRQHGKVTKLKTLRTNSNGYFSFGSTYSPQRTWAAGTKVGKQKLQGPYLPAYDF